ncbi:DUF5753 domain-containing protein [Nocardia sp. NPDC020380]|uniref:DUF5753 domain-containing protein n=1 Tax=Nocardia sp. NPDC020380 TaxID=3364309 RepID=UPI00378E737F
MLLPSVLRSNNSHHDRHTREVEQMQYTPWQRTCATGLAPLQRTILDEEARIRLNRTWQPELIIGLVQTERYARAVLSACISVLGVPDDVDEVTKTRMQRQRVLDQEGHEFWFLIGEAALRRTVGTHDIMTEQLAHLLDVMHKPSVSLGIVPLDAEYRAPGTGFVLHDDSQASTELVGGEIILDDPEQIALHTKTFDILSGQAVYREDAQQLIETAMRTHQSR